MEDQRYPSDIIRDANQLSAKACCGCGVINMGVGALRFRMTRDAFLAYVAELQGVAEEMQDDRRSMPFVPFPMMKHLT